ncbi:MAG: pantoate--beta-alanine ligase [Bacteroidales bacterium]|nr:pantoate--beta-alanine ligase [Bacteroidales bacterium]
MIRISTIQDLQQEIASLRSRGGKIGFVPTMGALHEGHLSLVEACIQKGDHCVASIFVNPTQFNDPNDLRNYPRNPQRDCELLERSGCHVVFMPSEAEMYPEPDTRKFEFGEMGSVMEGKHRPGHFNGVAQIVTKLFDAVQADRAYFGQKDFQQLAIIKTLVAELHYPLEIVGCPIIREPDGLAMSSRNQLLSEEHRKAAPIIYQCLQEVQSRVGTCPVVEIEQYIESTINNHPLLNLEYFQIVERNTLRQVSTIIPENPLNACIAVFAGKVRLIDNVEIIL